MLQGTYRTLCFCAAFTVGLGEALAADFTIADWFLSTTVDNEASGQHESQYFYVVQNPFHGALDVHVGNSSSHSSYDFGWAEQFGTFLIQSTQAAEGVPTSMLFTASSGKVYVTPSVDLALTINAEWNYDLPADWMEANLFVTIYDPDNHVTIWGRSLEAETFPGEPAAGTLAFDGQVTLPAGYTWVLRYGMQLTTWGGTQGYTATGNGSVNFQLTPEPASVAILALVLLTLPRRRR